MQKSSIVHIIYSFRPNLGIDTVRAGFAKFPIVLLIWTLMKLSVLGVYPTFCCWATRRLKYEPNCKLISIQLSSDFNKLRATDAYKFFFFCSFRQKSLGLRMASKHHPISDFLIYISYQSFT